MQINVVLDAGVVGPTTRNSAVGEKKVERPVRITPGKRSEVEVKR